MVSSYCPQQQQLTSSVSSRFTIRAAILLDILVAFVVIVLLTADTYGARMVRLCIASVDPAKLSSQCVMCNRREFPLTVIDCTGITKMNDLIANPLSVQDATCLIYNCRQQVPDIKPEPYHGSVSQAVRTNYPSASGTRNYEMTAHPYGPYTDSPPVSRYGYLRGSQLHGGSPWLPLSSSIVANRNQPPLPYALVPAAYATPFGTRRIKAALVPLFRR